jgi:hypothetical protein
MRDMNDSFSSSKYESDYRLTGDTLPINEKSAYHADVKVNSRELFEK